MRGGLSACKGEGKMIPAKLKKGSHIRVIAPARSLGIIGEECRKIALERLSKMGLRVSFGRHVEEIDEFASSSVQSRLDDLHEAFADKTVDGVLTVVGGFNSVEILSGIDYRLIAENPKIFCGFSDITALANAIYAKTGLVTYSGAHFSTFGMLKGIEYTIEYFQKCLFQKEPFEVLPSEEWADDPWYIDQEKRNFIKNEGYWDIVPGKAEGRLVGGNLGLLDELKGTPYFPDIKDCVLFLEHCAEHEIWTFNRNLQALCLHPDFASVRAVVFGRFEPENKMNRPRLERILAAKKELAGKPIVANVDFGHTTPIITFPVGGYCRIDGMKIELMRF